MIIQQKCFFVWEFDSEQLQGIRKVYILTFFLFFTVINEILYCIKYVQLPLFQMSGIYFVQQTVKLFAALVRFRYRTHDRKLIEQH